MLDEDFDPDHRELCADGNCTGVLGPDGKCKACGLQGDVPTPYREGQPAPLFKGEEPEPEAKAAPDDDDHAGFDEDRRLCADGSCTGLVSSDGKCKLCGKPAEAPDAS